MYGNEEKKGLRVFVFVSFSHAAPAGFTDMELARRAGLFRALDAGNTAFFIAVAAGGYLCRLDAAPFAG